MTIAEIADLPNNELYAVATFKPKLYSFINTSGVGITQGVTVQPSSEKILNYYQEVPNPGVYLISFNAPVDNETINNSALDVDKLLSKDIINVRPCWIATTFVDIR